MREFLNNPSTDHSTRFIYRMAFGLPQNTLYRYSHLDPLELNRVLLSKDDLEYLNDETRTLDEAEELRKLLDKTTD